jgi:hypothetical protein
MCVCSHAYDTRINEHGGGDLLATNVATGIGVDDVLPKIQLDRLYRA